ncbi:uncharacterized protein LOC125843057 [Solanum stenotomum]|uniref:uncharacterized protein LOC125843057 n=1 Tax=Solanum stenotomum TaxID=172797 RepID=UPI0020D10999|nr:uncharacterized protein LOC125843057 [Solanum stenotomum]
MGLGPTWLKWIEFCIKTTRFSILVNGEHVGLFSAERGLRQGDPLSPFLFIIAMEGLDSLMRRASLNNWIRGFRIKNRVNEVIDMTHLLYAVDTIIFGEAEQEQLCHIRIILCKIERLPTVYLGLPLGAKLKAVNIRDGVLEKSERRLELWKSQYLSLGEKLL